MANLENNSLDTRTFGQFCDGLTKRQWVELQGELAQKLKRSLQCIYNWKKGSQSTSIANSTSLHVIGSYSQTLSYDRDFPLEELHHQGGGRDSRTDKTDSQQLLQG